MLWAFAPVAIVVTLTSSGHGDDRPQRAARRSRAGVLTILGIALKVTGAVVLVWMGVQSLRRARAGAPAETPDQRPARPLRDGVITSLANPKLAVAVSRAKQAVVRTRVARWMERVTGAVLLGLGARVALEG